MTDCTNQESQLKSALRKQWSNKMKNRFKDQTCNGHHSTRHGILPFFAILAGGALLFETGGGGGALLLAPKRGPKVAKKVKITSVNPFQP